MMETTKEFTEEATQVLESYVSSVSKALEDTELTTKEIEESITELRYHIISQCEIRAKSHIITTDLVKLSIKKLGDPKTIAESLQSELNFTDEIKNQQSEKSPAATNSSHQENSQFQIRAVHLTAIYGTLCWLMTAVVIFVSFSAEFSLIAWTYPYLYAAAVGGLILTRNLDAYMYNNHLQEFIKPNFHTNIIPVVYLLAVFGLGVFIPNSAIWTMPATIVIWLILSTTDYGRQFYLDLIVGIKDMILNSK